MKRMALFFILLIICLCFTGCNHLSESTNIIETDKLSEDVSTHTSGDTIADSFLNDSDPTSLGMFSFGIVSENDEKQVYEYNGNELHIPFKVMGLDEKISSDFGLLVFVDGIPQPFKMLKKNGEVIKEQYMHKFYLKNEEKQEFDIVFTPVAGEKGERVGVVFATILKPDFIPNEQRATYGIYHSLNANLAQEIYFQCESSNKKELLKNSNYRVEEIPQEVIDKFANFETSDDYNTLDSNFVTELSSQNDGTEVIKANNGKLKFQFRIYGGQEATYRTVFFIDHQPVRIADADYLETKTTKGKMCSVELELDIGNLNKLSTLYAITNPAGKDYMAVSIFPIKTRSFLIVNDKGNEEDKQTGIVTDQNKTVIDGTGKISAAESPDNNAKPGQYASFDYETNSLLLTDRKTNKLIKKTAFEKNSYAQSIHKYDKGYIVQVNDADAPVKIEKDAYGASKIFPKEINRCILRVYDEILNLKKEINVGSELPRDLWGPLPQSAVSEDGDKVVWVFLRKLFICEVSSAKIEKIFDDDGNDVYFSQVCFTKDNKNVVFTGSSIQTKEGDCVFGLIELDDKKMSLHVEKKYHSNSIQVTTGYACIRDNGKPFVGTSSGRVPILDLQTKKAFTIKVGGSESTHARVSEDGKYLITVQEIATGNYRIRQYRLPAGEMVNEKSISPDIGVLWNADIIYTGNASTYELAGIAEDGKYAGYSFVLEDK